MSQSLPDPLSLWVHASCAPTKPVNAETMAASLIALWGNQEEFVKTLGAALGHEQLAELVIELMLQPLKRQAQLMSLAAIPNPEQALVLGAALSTWLVGQVAIAQAAAMDLQPCQGKLANESMLQDWVRAFAKRQDDYLKGADGRRNFAALSQAWAGLDVPTGLHRPQRGEGSAHLRAMHSASEHSKLVVLASPWCPLASMMSVDGGLLHILAKSFDVQVFDWGDLRAVNSIDGLRQIVQTALTPVIEQRECKFLDLSDITLLANSIKAPVYRLNSSLGAERLRDLVRDVPLQQLGLSRDYIPGELLAVLCDVLYPDWAVSAWLDCSNSQTALQTRRAWLAGLPALSGELLAALCMQEAPARISEVDSTLNESITLFQLLNGEEAAQLGEYLAEVS